MQASISEDLHPETTPPTRAPSLAFLHPQVGPGLPTTPHFHLLPYHLVVLAPVQGFWWLNSLLLQVCVLHNKQRPVYFLSDLICQDTG